MEFPHYLIFELIANGKGKEMTCAPVIEIIDEVLANRNWLLYTLNSTTRNQMHYCGKVMQMDSIRLELKLEPVIQAWR